MYAFRPQPFRCRNLCCNDSFGVTRAASVDVGGIFPRGNERRHGIHVGGKYNFRVGMSRRCRENVAALQLRGDFLRRISHANKFLA